MCRVKIAFPSRWHDFTIYCLNAGHAGESKTEIPEKIRSSEIKWVSGRCIIPDNFQHTKNRAAQAGNTYVNNAGRQTL